MRHLIDPLDFTQQEISTLLDLADRIHDDPAAYQEVARHKKLATLFYEPSTRTRLSFEAAMLNLGGHVLGFPSENVSSASKGESVADTIRVVSCYADIVAMRHPKEGAPLRASRYSRIPVINAGDGGHQHPTQTRTDLMTIRRRMGRLDDLTIGLCGDLKFGRTVHSLIKTMARCKNIRFVLISPEELRVPDYIVKDVLEANGIPYQETRSLEESMSELDILYMTRVQKERFFNEEDYIRLKNSYILTKEKMGLAKPDMAVLHPLPRVNEIALDVDDDPRAAYFEQVQNGVYVRMALIMTLLGLRDPRHLRRKTDMLNIDEIQNGIVIDHIKAGTAIGLMDLLGIAGNRTASVALIQNARSSKTASGRKDIIKVEGDASWLNLDVLAYLDPGISVTIIENGKAVRKEKPMPPKRLVNIVKCRNPRCISSIEEECDQIFELSSNGKYRCIYCEQELQVKPE